MKNVQFFKKFSERVTRLQVTFATWLIRAASGYLRKQNWNGFVWDELSDLEEGEKYRLIEFLPRNPFISNVPVLLIKARALLGPAILYDPSVAETRLVMMKTSEYDRVSCPKEGDTIMRNGNLYVKTEPPRLFS